MKQTTTKTRTNKAGKTTAKTIVVKSAKQQNAKNARNISMMLPISHCGLHYAVVLADPFHANHGACVPSELFPIPSQKIAITTRGNFTCGTSGIGFILLNPSVTSDSSAGLFTAAGAVGTASTIFTSFTGTQNLFEPNNPYPVSAITAKTLQVRIVGVGVRARYAGSLMNRNGTAVAFEEPDHQPISGLSFDTIRAKPQAEETDVTNWQPDQNNSGNWMASVCYSGPTQPSDVEFLSSSNPLAASTAPASAFMGIVVQGASGDNWAYEITQHVEYIGSTAPERTPSHADPVTFSKAVEAAKTISAIAPLKPERTSSFLGLLKDGIQASLPIIRDGANFVKSIVTMDVGSVLSTGAALLGNSGAMKLLQNGSQHSHGSTMTTRRAIDRKPYDPFGMGGGVTYQ